MQVDCVGVGRFAPWGRAHASTILDNLVLSYITPRILYSSLRPCTGVVRVEGAILSLRCRPARCRIAGSESRLGPAEIENLISYLV